MARTLEALLSLPESHTQYTILRYCLSACKVNDLLRACPLAHGRKEYERLSRLLQDAVVTIAGTPLTPRQWDQATLAIRCGGLGIQDPVRLRPAARVSGILDFLRIGPEILRLAPDDHLLPVDMGDSFVALQELVGPIDPLTSWSGWKKKLKFSKERLAGFGQLGNYAGYGQLGKVPIILRVGCLRKASAAGIALNVLVKGFIDFLPAPPSGGR